MAQTTTPTPTPTPTPAPAASATPARTPPDSGRYMLLATHVIADALLLMGTEVGTGTPYAYPGVPSNQMAGLDEAGKAAVDKLFDELYGKDPPWMSANSPGHPDNAAAVAKAADEEAKAPAVSYQQAVERGQKEFAGMPVTGPLPSPSPMPLSGDHTITHGAILPMAMPPTLPEPPPAKA
jgi:hypothetical protein